MNVTTWLFLAVGIGLFVGIRTGWLGFSSHSVDDPRLKLAQAAQYGSAGDFSGAIRLATEVIEECPFDAEALALRGTAYRRAGEYLLAIADLDQAIELQPNLAVAYTQRAWAFQQANLDLPRESVLEDLTTAIELEPTESLPHVLRGNELAELGDLESAIADYDQAIRVNPQSYSAWGGRATAKVTLGLIEEAKEDLRRALSLNPPRGERQQIQAFLDQLTSM